MSIFYILPPRSFLGACFAQHLATLFPGLELESAAWPDLADSLVDTLRGQTPVYLVHREELPAGEDVEVALADGFGAEAGDEIIELRAGYRPGELLARQWRIRAAA